MSLSVAGLGDAVAPMPGVIEKVSNQIIGIFYQKKNSGIAFRVEKKLGYFKNYPSQQRKNPGLIGFTDYFPILYKNMSNLQLN